MRTMLPKWSCFLAVGLLVCSGIAHAESPAHETDTIQTSAGNLRITPVHHASLMIEFAGKVFHVDPTSQGDYSGLPKADVILITHAHGDHMDPGMVKNLSKPSTVVVAPAEVAETLTQAQVIRNGERKLIEGIEVEAVPMYNLVRGPQAGVLYHEKGRGNGYVLTWGGKRLYLSGDTECTPEMKALQNIDVAFVCMNLPYTMTPQEAAECVKAFRPKIIYPYHYGQSDLEMFTRALQNEGGIEIRIRKWY
jgi:L-ascorbate metabolism protein UlaG (beta-lactamase superfamily)